MRRIFSAVALLVAALVAPVQAATLTTACRGTSCEIFLSGVIEPGDAARLAQILRDPPNSRTLWEGVHLDSPGGDVEEALRLTALVREAMLYTQNADDLLHEAPAAAGSIHGYTCASACFLVLVAGANRYMRVDDAGGRIGFHRPFLDPDVDSGVSPSVLDARLAALIARLRAFLIAQGVSPHLTDAMIERPKTEMYWLSRSDVLREIGLAPSWYERLLTTRCPAPPATSAADQAEAFGRALLRQSACVREMRAQAQARLRRGPPLG